MGTRSTQTRSSHAGFQASKHRVEKRKGRILLLCFALLPITAPSPVQLVVGVLQKSIICAPSLLKAPLGASDHFTQLREAVLRHQKSRLEPAQLEVKASVSN